VASLWAALLPLVLGSALVPAQLVVTILLLRSAAGTRTAFSFVGGMTAVRLVQGAVFGLAVAGSRAGDDAATASTLKSTLLLIVAILLLVMAVKKLLTDEDPDAPPPAWHARTSSMRPRQAFLVGAGLLLVGPKFWVFNLSAIAAIEEAALGRAAGVAAYLAFVALAALPLLVVVGASLTAPDRSDVLLERMSAWLTRNNRAIVVGVGLVFGGWFLAQALSGLGVF
jgi:threonine/homoserine/homoserine lactone efflux protein